MHEDKSFDPLHTIVEAGLSLPEESRSYFIVEMLARGLPPTLAGAVSCVIEIEIGVLNEEGPAALADYRVLTELDGELRGESGYVKEVIAAARARIMDAGAEHHLELIAPAVSRCVNAVKLLRSANATAH